MASAYHGCGTPPQRPAPAVGDNPFIHMSEVARLAIVVYFVLWRIVPELGAALQFDTPAWDIVTARLFVRVVLELLLLLPFLLYRFAGTPTGWLHPLVLPGLLSIAKDIATDPYTLLTPVTALLIAPVVPQYELMEGMSLEGVLSIELKRDALTVLAQIAFLLGFAAYPRRARPVRDSRLVGVSSARMMVAVGFCFAVFLYFVQVNGGLLEHFTSLAGGRFRMGQSAGHFLVIIAVLPYLMVFWYLARPHLLRKPWFIALLAAVLFAQFATTGSRSGLFGPMIMMLAAWMLINRKTPALRVALLGLFITVFLGVLGDLRSSAWSNRGEVDFSVLTQMDLVEGIQSTVETRARNSALSGQIAVMHAVPDRVPHLYGTTYIASLAFFIPRTIWPDKPRGPGAHVGAMIYGGMSSTSGYEGKGLPTGGVGEAYWNFGVPGVAAIYLLFGLFQRLVAHWFLQRPRDPLRAVIMLMAMLTLAAPDSNNIVSFLQALVLLMVTWHFARPPAAQVAPITPVQGPRMRGGTLHSAERVIGGAPLHGRGVAGPARSAPGRHGWLRW